MVGKQVWTEEIVLAGELGELFVTGSAISNPLCFNTQWVNVQTILWGQAPHFVDKSVEVQRGGLKGLSKVKRSRSKSQDPLRISDKLVLYHPFC